MARAEAILEAAAFAVHRLMVAPSWEEAVPEVLARLGRAAEATRVCISENQTLPDG